MNERNRKTAEQEDEKPIPRGGGRRCRQSPPLTAAALTAQGNRKRWRGTIICRGTRPGVARAVRAAGGGVPDDLGPGQSPRVTMAVSVLPRARSGEGPLLARHQERRREAGASVPFFVPVFLTKTNDLPCGRTSEHSGKDAPPAGTGDVAEGMGSARLLPRTRTARSPRLKSQPEPRSPSERDEDRGLTQRRDSSGPRSAGAEGPGRLPPTPRAALCLGGLRGTGSGPGGSNVKHEFLVGQELVFTINT